MRIMTVLGTRPEIIRLSLIIKRLDEHAQHTLVHTGQNYDPRLSEVFFQELGLRAPDVHLQLASGGFGAQIGSMFSQIEALLHERKPERLLILGDTNSGLIALLAKRLGIPVYHMEAGNRCFDDRVPEEVNRRVIDHSSSVLLPYTHNSKENLLAEGIPANRIYVTGNPILEVIEHFKERIEASRIHQQLGIEPQKFFLVTLHRAENVDDEARLRSFVGALQQLHRDYKLPVVASLHPRTRSKIQQFGVDTTGVGFHEPFGFFDFVRLEQTAFCVLSDSGTVQEECAVFGVANVTLRDVTERPETIECGSNILSGADSESIARAVRFVTSGKQRWNPPPEYMVRNVSEIVTRVLLGYRLPEHSELRWRQSFK